MRDDGPTHERAVYLRSLYHNARSRHLARREQALSSARRLITRPGYCASAIASEQIREWFDDWEVHLRVTYFAAQRNEETITATVKKRPTP